MDDRQMAARSLADSMSSSSAPSLDALFRPKTPSEGLSVLLRQDRPRLPIDEITGLTIPDLRQNPLAEPTQASGENSEELQRYMRRPAVQKEIQKLVRNQRRLMAENALSGTNVLRMAEALLALEDQQAEAGRHPVSVSIVWNEHGKELTLQGPYRTTDDWVADVRLAAQDINAFGYLVIARFYRRDTVEQRPNWIREKLRSFFRGNAEIPINPAIPGDGFIMFGEDITGENIAGMYPIVQLTETKRTIGFGMPLIEDMPSPFKGILTRSGLSRSVEPDHEIRAQAPGEQG